MALTEIGKYRVLGELGRGAMGAVYLAEDPFIGRRVAIKVMRPQVEEGSERFLREAKTVGSLSHPNIVLLHDFGFLGELPYLVMEHVPGVCLDKWLVDPHDVAERLRVLAGLCRAVAYAHQNGVLHRDLKPSNVLVRADGEAKLLDFGIARVQDTRMTATGIVLGTPEYLAPELLAGEGFSPSSDLYALGLVAYELFGGRNPFRADTVAACLRRVMEVAPAPLGAGSGAPPEVAAEIMACLVKDPALRPAGTERLLAAAERGLTGASQPLPPPVQPTQRLVPAEPAKPVRVRLVAAAAAVLLAVLGTAIWWATRDGARSSVGSASEGGPPAPAARATVQAPAGSTPEVRSTPILPTPSTREAAATKERVAGSETPRPTSDPTGPSGLIAPPRAEAPRGEPTREVPPPLVTPTATPAPPLATPPARDLAVAATATPPAVVPSPSPESSPRLLPPRLEALSPPTLRRGEQTAMRVRGERLVPGWTVRIRRGGREAAGVRVLRVNFSTPGEAVLSLLVEDDAPLGHYGLALVSATGESSNQLAFEVNL